MATDLFDDVFDHYNSQQHDIVKHRCISDSTEDSKESKAVA